MVTGTDTTKRDLDVRTLTGSMFDFARPAGANLLERTRVFEEWRARRSDAGLWPFSRVIHDAPGPDMDISDEAGHSRPGVSLACQDYLGLTSHPAVRDAARNALDSLGPHSAGSPALAGNTRLSLKLEKQLGDALAYEHVVLFPTGWAAGYAGIAGLVRPDDHIVMDQLSHACLQQGAFAATRNVRRHPHLDVESVRSALREIRAGDSTNGIMVISEGLFSMDSDVPNVAALQEVCHEYGATFLLDVAHDFGSLGPQGGGSLAIQGMLGKVDLVMGSFSKTFSSNGGFVATRSSAVRQYLKFYGSPQTFSNALSPIQSAVVMEALKIVRSEEGEGLRQGLMRNVLTLRNELETRGIRCIGAPSAIVPALVGDEAVGRIAWAEAAEQGIHANLVEFPAVAVGAARFRMQLMPTHRREQLVRASDVVAEAISGAREKVSGMQLPERRRLRVGPDAGTCAVGARALPSLKPGDLAKLFEGARIVTHKAGECLIQAGTNHGTLFVLRKGTVEIVVDHLGMSITVGNCGSGEVVGEMSMLDGSGASASVYAETDVEVACLDQAAVKKLAASDPDFGCRLYLSLAQVLARRLRRLDVHTLSAEFTV